MVETALNLFWLAIVVASVVAWACTRHRLLGRRRRQLTLEIIALAVALALLWAPISLTDNLHPIIFQAEDGGSTKRIAMAKAAAHVHHGVGKIPAPFIFPLSARPEFALGFFCQVAVAPNFSHFASQTRLLPANRAPPSLQDQPQRSSN